jgi:hypothetical protein
MTSQVNVFTGAQTNVVWRTDKVQINTGTNAVTFQVNVANIANAGVTNDTIYSNAVVIPANSSMEMFVGVGNFITITGGNASVGELGTDTSGSAAVMSL